MSRERGHHLTRRDALASGFAVIATPALGRIGDGVFHEYASQARSMAKSGETLRMLAPDGSQANLAPIVLRFSELTGISIEIETAAVREIGTTLLAERMISGKTYDVVLPPTHEIPDLAATKALRPLDGLPSSARLHRQERKTIYTHGDSFDGRTFGLQTDGDVFVMFLNRMLLDDRMLSQRYEDRFGEVFGPPASWEGLDRQVKFVAETLGRPGAAMFRDRGQIEWEFWLRLHAKGIWPLTKDFEPQFNSSEGREVLDEMMALSSHIFQSDGSGSSFLSVWQRFAASGAYATFGWGGTQKIFRRESFSLADHTIAAPVPGGDGPDTPDMLPYFNWGWSFAITQDTPNPDLALCFILFATSPELSTAAIREETGFFDPYSPEHYDDPQIEEIYGAPFLDVHRRSLANAIPDLYIANRGAYFDTLGGWLSLAINKTIDPGVALEKASDHWRLLANEREQAVQAERWRRLREKYPSAIAEKLRDVAPRNPRN